MRADYLCTQPMASLVAQQSAAHEIKNATIIQEFVDFVWTIGNVRDCELESRLYKVVQTIVKLVLPLNFIIQALSEVS